MSRLQPIQRLIESLAKLPGIGEKTAARLTFFIMNQPEEEALELGKSIIEVREKVHFCKKCFNFTDESLCSICRGASRDPHTVCIVANPGDLISIEKTGHFKGKYHVLHGVILPLEGIGPDQLKIRELLERVEREQIREIILATNPTMSGNATALYIAEQLKTKNVKITRIAQGIPTGGDIAYADEVTLKSALEGRQEIRS